MYEFNVELSLADHAEIKAVATEARAILQRVAAKLGAQHGEDQA